MQAAQEAAQIPQGMRVLPEEEQQEMLALLARSRAEEEEKLLVRLSGCSGSVLDSCHRHTSWLWYLCSVV